MTDNFVVRLTQSEFDKLDEAREEGKPVEVWTEDAKQHGLFIKSIKKIEPEKTPLYSDAVKALAIVLHDNFCGFNHTDGCGWGYEEGREDPWAKECYSHTHWAEKAKQIMQDNQLRTFKPEEIR
ncbi:MAG TPA: hypothetical protein DGG95_07255 [Cytophagales bacterium]|jgi:hypothetical protein|nr:hypothetical protein [Cytophagales bacterium]